MKLNKTRLLFLKVSNLSGRQNSQEAGDKKYFGYYQLHNGRNIWFVTLLIAGTIMTVEKLNYGIAGSYVIF